MLTASHNPPQYNGFKLCREHAIPIGEASGLKQIERLAAELANEPPARAPRHASSAPTCAAATSITCCASAARRPGCKVAIDCGNGMAAVGLEPLLERLPLEVTRLYFEPDGSLPEPRSGSPQAREPARRLRSGAPDRRRLRCRVRRRRGPGRLRRRRRRSRSRPICSRGCSRGASSRRHPGGRVLYDLRSSRVTAEEITAAGGVPEMCRVGHSFVKARMREVGAIFAGELSGHMYFRFSETLVADDGIAAFVAVLDLLAAERRPFSELVAPLRRYAAERRDQPDREGHPARARRDRGRARGTRPRSRTSTACASPIRTGGSICARRTPSPCCGSTWRPAAASA